MAERLRDNRFDAAATLHMARLQVDASQATAAAGYNASAQVAALDALKAEIVGGLQPYF